MQENVQQRSKTYVWKCKRMCSSVAWRMCGSARERTVRLQSRWTLTSHPTPPPHPAPHPKYPHAHGLLHGVDTKNTDRTSASWHVRPRQGQCLAALKQKKYVHADNGVEIAEFNPGSKQISEHFDHVYHVWWCLSARVNDPTDGCWFVRLIAKTTIQSNNVPIW